MVWEAFHKQNYCLINLELTASGNSPICQVAKAHRIYITVIVNLKKCRSDLHQTLEWLPITLRIKTKILTMAYMALGDQAPCLSPGSQFMPFTPPEPKFQCYLLSFKCLNRSKCLPLPLQTFLLGIFLESSS